MKPSLTVFYKKFITSAYCKSTNSFVFNLILQNMIFEMIFCKTMCRIFLIFCRSRFIVKNNFSEPWNYQKLNISRPIYFLKNSAHRFEDLVFTSWKNFFQKKLITYLELFSRLRNHSYGRNFFTQEINFTLFQVWIFTFNSTLKACFTSL